MSNINFGTSSLQTTTTTNTEILIPFKPVNYNGAFIASYISFVPFKNCNVILNNNAESLFIPAGAFEFSSIYELYSFKIVQSDIPYVLSGVAPSSNISNDNQTNIYSDILGASGLSAQPSQISLTNGQTTMLSVKILRDGLYQNIINPNGTIFTSNNTNVVTVSQIGLITYVGAGITDIIVVNGSYSDIVKVICD